MSSETSSSNPSKRAVWPGYLLGLYAVAAGAFALWSLKVSPPGWAVAVQPLMAMMGLAGGLLLLCGDPWWRPLLWLWALAQGLVVVLDTSGALTRQPFLWFAYSNVAGTVVGEQLTQMRGYAINVAGLVLFALTHTIMARKWYVDVPVQRWQFLLLRLVRTLFVLSCLALAGYLGWLYAPLVLVKDPLVVITSPLPGAEAYAGGRKLGTTPLVINQEKLVEWGLSQQAGVARCQLVRTPLDEGLRMGGNKESAVVLFRPPWWCEKHFETFGTEWGPRAVMVCGFEPTNHCEVRLFAKSQPGPVLSLPDGLPVTVAAGGSIELSVALRRNPFDPLLKPAPAMKNARKAVLLVTFLMGGGPTTREINLPETWCDVSPGPELRQTVKVAVPPRPGKCEVRVQYRLFGGADSQQRLDSGWVRDYGFLTVQ